MLFRSEIKGFLAVNPKGNLQELFSFYDSSFRTRYYKHKPEGYQYPNAGRKVPKDKLMVVDEKISDSSAAIAKFEALGKISDGLMKTAEMIDRVNI